MKQKTKIISLCAAALAVVAVIVGLVLATGLRRGTSPESIEAASSGSEPAKETAASSGIGESAPASESSEASDPAPEPSKEPFVADRSEVFAILADMNVGWNLGNTFDAIGSTSVLAETYWGNPKTTKEMIDAIAAQGFNTIRIPVSWKDHVGNAPDYKIDPLWLNRVQEVVDYCVANDLYIIMDTHHEPDGWLVPDPEKYDKVSEQLKAIWTQIAEHFKEYDKKLIFEGMNEPRTKGTEKEWSGGTEKEQGVVNKLNKDFVDAVRATGGNNADRILIICPYGNNNGYKVLKNLMIPEDNNIAVAVHLYTPYFFTYQPESGNINEWTGAKKGEIVSAMKSVDQYLIKKGVPAIITEFGAVHKIYESDGKQVDNEEQVLLWLEDYLTTTESFGIPCVWWDNGVYTGSGEKFGIFNRRECTWYSQNIADALIRLTTDDTQE